MVTPGALQNALLLRSDPLRLFTQLANSDDKITQIELPAGRAHLVHEPALVAQLLLERTGTIQKHMLPGILESFGAGLFTSSGRRHSIVRQASQSAFHRLQIEARTDEVQKVVEKALAQLGEGDRDVKGCFEQMTLSIVGRVVFGLDLRSVCSRFFACAEQLQELFQQSKVSPAAGERFQAASREMDQLLTDALVQDPGARTDGLLRAFEEAGLTEQQIAEELRSFLLANIPLSLLLANACWLLAAHPLAQTQLREDNDAVWTEYVVNETLRLYPPGWLLIREAVDSIELDGVAYPAKSIFLVCVWTLHRSPKFFSQPELFQPERWREKREIPRGAYIPFSLGSRSCVGERLGRLVAQHTLDAIVRQYHLMPSSEPQGPWLPRITLAPRAGIWVKLQTHENS